MKSGYVKQHVSHHDYSFFKTFSSVVPTFPDTFNVDVGLDIFKFSFDNASKIGALLLFIFGIGLFIKYGWIAVVSYFIPKQ